MKQISTNKNSVVLTPHQRSICQRNLFFKYCFGLLLAGLAMIVSCQKESLQSSSQKPDLLNNSQKYDFNKNNLGPLQINFAAPNVFPEGIAYDPGNYRFFVSSSSTGDIGIVTPDGAYKTFIKDKNLTVTTGIRVDKDRQYLWVCNRDNGIGVYNLKSGAPIFFTDLSLLLPGVPVFINDVILDPAGNAYVTNTVSPVIYKVTPDGKASIFFQNDAFATGPNDFGFNGIQLDKKGFLLVAFSNEVVKIPVGNPNNYSIVKLDGVFYPDGLLLSKDGKQLVLVNDTGGTPDDSVLSFITTDDWKSGTLSTSFSTGAVFPSDLATDGKRVFVVYSHLDKLIAGASQDTFTIQEISLKVASTF
jgi:sugar lactone lactonase YvrE